MESAAENPSSIPGCSADQQFRLCWKNHSDNLRESFSHNQLRENYVDVTIACGSVFIKAHKLVLSASSSFFRKLFKVHDVPHPVVVLDSVNPEHMQYAIEFMYRGEIDVKNSDLANILSIGEKFGIKGLSSVKLSNQQDQTKTAASNTNSSSNEKDPLTLDKENKDKNEKEKPSSSGASQEGATSNNSQAATSSSDNDNDDLCTTICTTVETPEFQPYTLDTSPKLSHSSGSIFMDPKTMEPVKVPRPPNAFMLFARQWRKKLATENPTEQNKVISKRLGLKWQQLSAYEKQKYFVAAEKAQKEHMKKYPGYVYNPKEARIRKDLREKRMHPVQLVQFVMSEPMRQGQPVTMVNASRSRTTPTTTKYAEMETDNYEEMLDDEIELVEEKVVPNTGEV